MRNILLVSALTTLVALNISTNQPEQQEIIPEAAEVVVSASDSEPEPEQEVQPEPLKVSVEDIVETVDYSLEAEYIAKTIWGEARGCSVEEQEQVVWCILNRVDSEIAYFPDDIIGVVTQPYQFHGYSADYPVTEEHYQLALDVLERWEAEKRGETIQRNLGKEFLYFHGDGKHNYFRVNY